MHLQTRLLPRWTHTSERASKYVWAVNSKIKVLLEIANRKPGPSALSGPARRLETSTSGTSTSKRANGFGFETSTSSLLAPAVLVRSSHPVACLLAAPVVVVGLAGSVLAGLFVLSMDNLPGHLTTTGPGAGSAP